MLFVNDKFKVTRLPEYDPFCPIHGSRRRVARREHLVTMQHLMTSIDQDISDDIGYLYNHDFLAKIIRKKKKEQLSGAEKIKVGKVIHKIKNFWSNKCGKQNVLHGVEAGCIALD
ncbi:hypothetical protein DICVIV_12661 [Dictyocaulus viviparus]|uniref:Uncharacterized protein n=1 Tax=Dictyocaulus viviparus TaxID=29172 RepID=A0A0D8X9U9_DICVI|nr:hypothetical protein DICVIV_12661 [Dictyocaulus viviparus]